MVLKEKKLNKFPRVMICTCHIPHMSSMRCCNKSNSADRGGEDSNCMTLMVIIKVSEDEPRSKVQSKLHPSRHGHVASIHR
jgi:hypothetical protein